MIVVENLAKNYGLTQALKGISFEVKRGEVIGFLGPNGAGKSTTMKILTGYLLPTGGRASVDNLDVVDDSLAVRRRLGYLPESTPLYTEMLVEEYLRFAAEIRGVRGRDVRSSVSRVVDTCGLGGVTGKSILELSKGYRQRVGLAQAMVHNPDVLILDEPTSGLDPNQIVEVRSLIMRLGEQHTVILSTHYLQEVEASCSRIIIVTQGSIVANDTHENLVSGVPARSIRARIKGPADNVNNQLRELFAGKAVEQINRDGDYGHYKIECGAARDRSPEEALAELVHKNGWALAELTRDSATLEDVFRNLTLANTTEAGHA
ncbi:MAG: ATP-binding cassette domain-containing protein [Planctomycetota bacterium]